MPFSTVEAVQETQEFVANPLVDRLTAEACQCEGIDETVTRHLDLKKFKALLPKLFSCLSEKEGMVLKLKFFEELTGVEIAKRLDISEGRASQLSRIALTKLEKLYLSRSIQSW
ncbi:sigma-70 family RNA polymerase sigma factor [Candidatus Poribacteria bacterium]|nr:sigma-70 family RNA polymerase sigma factor [Candidatus Poribacteria bacterium]